VRRNGSASAIRLASSRSERLKEFYNGVGRRKRLPATPPIPWQRWACLDRPVRDLDVSAALRDEAVVPGKPAMDWCTLTTTHCRDALQDRGAPLSNRDGPLDYHDATLKRSNDLLQYRADALQYRRGPQSNRDGPFDFHNASLKRTSDSLKYHDDALQYCGALLSNRDGAFDFHDATLKRSADLLQHHDDLLQ